MLLDLFSVVFVGDYYLTVLFMIDGGGYDIFMVSAALEWLLYCPHSTSTDWIVFSELNQLMWDDLCDKI